jgi:2,4-dienoyl-CoA reductase-like NADH-dependent reductase (Old Yellow Enzyme family)
MLSSLAADQRPYRRIWRQFREPHPSALAIARDVRALWPQDKPLFVRLSAVDGSSKGWTIADSVTFAKILKDVGVDVIDCSSGGFNVYEYPDGYSFQVPFAAQIAEKQRSAPWPWA